MWRGASVCGGMCGCVERCVGARDASVCRMMCLGVRDELDLRETMVYC